MKGETKSMFFIIAPHNEGGNLSVCSESLHHTMKGETMFLIIAPHNEGRH